MPVSIYGCSSYEENKVQKAVDRLLMDLGGIEKFIKPGDNVVIKPNFIARRFPTDAATTNPALLLAITRAVMAVGGHVTIAESPGGPYSGAILKRLYETCGASYVAEMTGCDLNYDTSYENIVYHGKVRREFSIISPIIKADKVISVAKLKTHTMTCYTGAVKNLFGTIPGLYKTQYHFERAEKSSFCSMLVDLCQYVNPCLSFIDAVVAMEGDGPTSGTPREIGAILASQSPYELDLAAIHMVGISEEEALTVKESLEQGLTPPYDELTITGDSIDSFAISNFKRARGGDISFLKRINLPDSLTQKINRAATARPVFDKKICVGCGECARCCPPKAIELIDHFPQVNFDKCIHCFCCQELCPQKAVTAKRNFIFDKLFRI